MSRLDEETLERINTAREAVGRLVEQCRKGGALYKESPKAVAQVSCTGKWLLNAITALRRHLDTACDQQEQAAP
jgi:hypothetical protein